jgi:hypothetical protein
MVHFLSLLVKEFLSDGNCNRRAASVSGHFILHVFILALPAYVRTMRHRIVPVCGPSGFTPWHGVFFAVCYAGQVVMSSVSMYHTWAFGYHSLRQARGVCVMLGAWYLVSAIFFAPLDLATFTFLPFPPMCWVMLNRGCHNQIAYGVLLGAAAALFAIDVLHVLDMCDEEVRPNMVVGLCR